MAAATHAAGPPLHAHQPWACMSATSHCRSCASTMLNVGTFLLHSGCAPHTRVGRQMQWSISPCETFRRTTPSGAAGAVQRCTASACVPTMCTYVVHRTAISWPTQGCTVGVSATFWSCSTHMFSHTDGVADVTDVAGRHIVAKHSIYNGQDWAGMYSQWVPASHGHAFPLLPTAVPVPTQC